MPCLPNGSLSGTSRAASWLNSRAEVELAVTPSLRTKWAILPVISAAYPVPASTGTENSVLVDGDVPGLLVSETLLGFAPWRLFGQRARPLPN